LSKRALSNNHIEEFYVYVIGLKPEFAETKAAKSQNPDFVPKLNKKCYYVGYSSHKPEIRYQQHITGYINKKGYKIFSQKVFKYGYKKGGLRWKKFEKYNPISTKEEAMKIEIQLAEKIRKNGHCVYQK